MEVTRKNFRESLPLVADSIDKADFLVIDAEFTGLINGREVSIFDTPEEYYNTLLSGASDFLLIQFGLCAFYWDENVNYYMNEAYNFYLFPRGRPGPERMFLCQSSSLDFLAAQGFDFNKLIKEGISYMSEPVETRLRENLTERQKSAMNEGPHITIPEENKKQIDEVCAKVRNFLDENTSDEFEIDRCNAFVRRLLYQELGSRFKKEAFVETKVLENKNRVLKVSRIKSDTDGKSRDILKREREWEEFEDAVGFSKVARMISQSDKLVVGHNMLLDLIHTLNHFFQPLPTDYATFKEFAHCMFPKILDTKYMSSLPPFKDKVNSSVLSHLLATLSEPPFALPKSECVEGRGYSQEVDKSHEAGYDAFATGLCLLSMHAHLASMRGESLDRARVRAASPALRPFLNKVFLAKTAYQDSPYINLTGADPNPPRDHVFHLTFPKDWTRNDLNQLFSPFCSITVHFLDETSALVGLSRRDQARSVQRALAKNGRVALQPYQWYKHSKTPHKEQEDLKKDYRSDYTLIYARGAESPPKTQKVNSGGAPKQRLPEKVDRQLMLPEKVERPKVVEKASKLPEKVKRETIEKSSEKSTENLEKSLAKIQNSTKKLEKSTEQFERATEMLKKVMEMTEKTPEKAEKSTEKAEKSTEKAEKSTEKAEKSKKVEKAEKSKMVEKNERQRSHSVSAPASLQPTPTRKRTSSGVFHVDEAEPPPKKHELVRTNSEGGRRRPEAVPNGRRKTSEGDSDGHSKKERLVTDNFDSTAKSKCVSAFKESDSWD